MLGSRNSTGQNGDRLNANQLGGDPPFFEEYAFELFVGGGTILLVGASLGVLWCFDATWRRCLANCCGRESHGTAGGDTKGDDLSDSAAEPAAAAAKVGNVSHSGASSEDHHVTKGHVFRAETHQDWRRGGDGRAMAMAEATTTTVSAAATPAGPESSSGVGSSGVAGAAGLSSYYSYYTSSSYDDSSCRSGGV